jgi:signal transduction histidine kinase
VEAHGGKLTAENRDGGGARFTINLPVRVTDENLLDATS